MEGWLGHRFNNGQGQNVRKLNLIIRNALIPDGRVVDIGVESGKISRINDHINSSGAKEIDAQGRLTAPSFIDPHCHMDKAFLYRFAGSKSKHFSEGRQVLFEAKRQSTKEDVKKRAEEMLRLDVLHGTTYIRTHVDVDTSWGLTGVEALLELKKEYANVVDMQIVAFPQEGIFRDQGAEELMWKAMESGVDIVGGAPSYELTEDAIHKHIQVVFEIAKKLDKDIDMHIDTVQDPYSRTLEYYAAKAFQEHYMGRVTAGHCSALSAYAENHARRVVNLVKQAGLNVIVCPKEELILEDMDLPRVKMLLEAGVNVVYGHNNMNDPFNPFGNADMLTVGMIFAHATQLKGPDEIRLLLDMPTINSAKILRIPDYGISEGCRADFNIIDAKNILDAFRLQPDRLYVVKRGEVIAKTKSEIEFLGKKLSAG